MYSSSSSIFFFLCTFTFLGCWLLPLLHVTTSPLHPLPAAEHVIILICGDLLWILILRKDACEEIQDERVRRDEVKHSETSKSEERRSDRRLLPSLRSRSLPSKTRREKKNTLVWIQTESRI